MNEVLEGKRGGATASADAGGPLLRRLDDLVSPRVVEPAERRRHAVTLGVLVSLGLIAALASPALVILKAGALVAALPMVVAALAIATASLLAVTGALQVMIWLGATLVFAALGASIAANASAFQLALPVFLVLPLEALLAHRRRLAAGLAVSAALAAVVPLAATAAAPDLGTAHLVLAGAALAYGARLVRRGQRPATAAVPSPEAAAVGGCAAADFTGAALLTLETEGRVRAASAAAREMLGGPEGEIVGAALSDLIHVADRVAVLQALDGLRRGSEPQRIPARLTRPGQAPLPAMLTIGLSPIEASVVPEIWIGLAAPETDTREAEVLEAALQAANQASAAKTQFLAAVSHELRTPLNAIIGFSDILDQEFFGGFESVQQKEYVGLIRQSGQHLLQVVNTLLDVSKIEAGRYELHPEPFVLAEAMAEAGDLMREEARRKGLRIDVRGGCEDVELVADRHACQQVLLNLLSNAVKFTDEGVVTLESRVDGDAVELCVSDTGIGISPHDLERLGRPFVQVSTGAARRYPGTGLGLSLVKGLVELHGGSMAVTSHPGVGTMVSVRLPRDGCPLPAPSNSNQENIVALSDARTKTTHSPQARETRRSA
ncbi:sensor histidine kinase [Jiella sp. M17.18]|uniref:sensor histidine kinase n=1 Tax=Jiella sp. M17.18 TaxID=3234247 RepID=UPI0034DEDAAF